MKDFDLRKYLADNRLLKEEIDVNKILSDGGYVIIDDEELLMTVKNRLKGKSNIDAKKLNLLVMKIEDEEGGNIDFTENKLLKEDQTDLFVKAGFGFEDGLLGGVGSGGGGYYDFISDKISGFNIDKFDEEEFNNWYDNFSKKDFNSLVYDSEEMEDYGIDPSGLPKGIHQLQDAGAGEVMDDKITIYAYPTLIDDRGSDFITIFSLDKNGNVVPRASKEEVKAKLASNEYSII